jgi:hypothetical protein
MSDAIMKWPATIKAAPMMIVGVRPIRRSASIPPKMGVR